MDNFQRWDHVLIDGSGVCYALYFREKYRWDLGGEYDKFSYVVEHFFKEAHFKNPIVVLDGCAGHDPSKLDTARRRREQSMREMERVQRHDHRTPANASASTKPLMLISAFMDVLRKLGIEFHVVDGEADTAVAALANHYKCPVLGSDSDYFMFELEEGFVHFDRYYQQGNNSALFKISEFMKQYHLKRFELCLILPSTFGNDFAKSSARRSHDEYSRLLGKLSEYRSYSDYLDRNGDAATRANFAAAQRFYHHLSLPAILHVEGAPATNEKFTVFPKWVFDGFTKGCFPPSLVNVYHNKLYLLPMVVEVIGKESAWLMSRSIRQLLYGFMGLSADAQVTEIIRKHHIPAFDEEQVLPVLEDPRICIRDSIFSDRSESNLSGLVLSVLGSSNDELFQSLDGKWKLPIAATYYWYKKLADVVQRRDLVISLLLSFFACSKIINKELPLHASTPSARPDHLTALHAFAQWQCTYFDARALNYLAREPFPTTSPASLYSGEVAMHYATSVPHERNWIDDFLDKDSEEWSLFSKFLHIITGCDEASSRTQEANRTVYCYKYV